MEIPDLFVVNKSDHGETAQRTLADLRAALVGIDAAGAGDRVPIVATSARDGTGVDDLADALEALRAATTDAARLARRRRGLVSWTLGAVRRRDGERGVELLGGTAALRAEIERRLGAGVGQGPLAVAQTLSDEVCERLRRG
jgi:putative protein kinase ArgK-like GTPase of G3E family